MRARCQNRDGNRSKMVTQLLATRVCCTGWTAFYWLLVETTTAECSLCVQVGTAKRNGGADEQEWRKPFFCTISRHNAVAVTGTSPANSATTSEFWAICAQSKGNLPLPAFRMENGTGNGATLLRPR